MFFKSLHILGILTSVVSTHRNSHESFHPDKDLESIKLNPRIIENREQLKRIIKYLNGHHDEYERKENSVLGDFVPKDIDVENNIIAEQEGRILTALNLLQKNYNSVLRHGNEKKRPRLLYIDNPEVLEEYKNNLRASVSRLWSSSDSNSDSTESDYSDYDRILADELSGHRKFDIVVPSKDKNLEKHHNRSKHKNHGKVTKDTELGNGKNINQKGRFKIARDKRIPQIIEGKRPKIEKKDDKRIKISDENLDTGNLKFDKKEKITANVVLKELTNDRDVPSRPKYTDKKYSRGDMWDKEDDFVRKRPVDKEFNPNKRGGRISQSLGRTFIPYIATKTVYEDD